MKIIIFADSHTDVETMSIVVESEHPNMIIHLGDHVNDGRNLQKIFNNIPMEFIRGNTDKTDAYPTENILKLKIQPFLFLMETNMAWKKD